MSVGFSQLAGGWQINGRGTIYTTKVLAEAAEKKGAAPNITYGTDAEFKKAMAAVVVLQPKLTPEMLAKVELDSLKAVLANNPNKTRKALTDTQIAALLDKWPNLKRDELALQAKALKAKESAAAKVASDLLVQKAKERREDEELHARLMATDPAYAARQRSLAEAKTDWGVIPAFAGVLAAGAAVVATGGVAAGALAGGVTLGGGLTAAASTVAVVQSVAELVKGEVPSLAVPGLAKAGVVELAGVTGAADLLVAANELGGAPAERAREIVEATRTLATAGNADAVMALNVILAVAKERVELEVPAGMVRPLTPAGAQAVEDFALRDTLAAPPAMPASFPDAVRGQLIHTGGELAGRLNFSTDTWRPVLVDTPGAVVGLLVSDLGRIAFNEYWVPA